MQTPKCKSLVTAVGMARKKNADNRISAFKSRCKSKQSARFAGACIDDVYVALSDIPKAGRGVFTKRPIEEGSTIAEMIDPQLISAGRFKKLCKQHGMRQDCGFICKDGIVLLENAFCRAVPFRTEASWYCFNHAPINSSELNLKIERAVRNNLTTITFKAARRIAGHEELRYAYDKDLTACDWLKPQ